LRAFSPQDLPIRYRFAYTVLPPGRQDAPVDSDSRVIMSPLTLRSTMQPFKFPCFGNDSRMQITAFARDALGAEDGTAVFANSSPAVIVVSKSPWYNLSSVDSVRTALAMTVSVLNSSMTSAVAARDGSTELELLQVLTRLVPVLLSCFASSCTLLCSAHAEQRSSITVSTLVRGFGMEATSAQLAALTIAGVNTSFVEVVPSVNAASACTMSAASVSRTSVAECSGHGVCSITANLRAVCACDYGYTGERCGLGNETSVRHVCAAGSWHVGVWHPRIDVAALRGICRH
jgi:hypothetical protein